MFSKGKGLPQMPSEMQAKEKSVRLNTSSCVQLNLKFIIDLTLFFFAICRLVVYVYEYLMNLGAKNSAQTFLSEVNTF
jgi:hypothetical protein